MLAAGCGETVIPAPAFGLDPITSQLVEEYRLQASGQTEVSPIAVGDPVSQPWDLYLRASRRIGLDFAAAVGAPAELRTTPIAGSTLAQRIHVLVLDGVPIGAWLSSDSAVPGVYSLTGEA